VPADVQFDAEGWVLIQISKGLVVLLTDLHRRLVARGKGWKRRAAVAQRTAQEDGNIACEPLLDHRTGE